MTRSEAGGYRRRRRSGREWAQGVITSGTFAGLALGLFLGVGACGFGGWLLVRAFQGDGPFTGEPVSDVLPLALGVMFIGGGLNCAVSGVVAWVRAPLGEPSTDMAGEELVAKALDRRAAWAVASVLVFGIAVAVVGLILLVDIVNGETPVSPRSLLAGIVVLGLGLFLAGAALRSARR